MTEGDKSVHVYETQAETRPTGFVESGVEGVGVYQIRSSLPFCGDLRTWAWRFTSTGHVREFWRNHPDSGFKIKEDERLKGFRSHVLVLLSLYHSIVQPAGIKSTSLGRFHHIKRQRPRNGRTTRTSALQKYWCCLVNRVMRSKANRNVKMKGGGGGGNEGMWKAQRKVHEHEGIVPTWNKWVTLKGCQKTHQHVIWKSVSQVVHPHSSPTSTCFVSFSQNSNFDTL